MFLSLGKWLNICQLTQLSIHNYILSQSPVWALKIELNNLWLAHCKVWPTVSDSRRAKMIFYPYKYYWSEHYNLVTSLNHASEEFCLFIKTINLTSSAICKNNPPKVNLGLSRGFFYLVNISDQVLNPCPASSSRMCVHIVWGWHGPTLTEGWHPASIGILETPRPTAAIAACYKIQRVKHKF